MQHLEALLVTRKHVLSKNKFDVPFMIIPFYGRHSRPFSLSDFSVGSGGTLPMQALVARPAMNTWHVAQSPLSK